MKAAYITGAKGKNNIFNILNKNKKYFNKLNINIIILAKDDFYTCLLNYLKNNI